MEVDSDPLKDMDMMYIDIAGCNMVEAIVNAVEKLTVEAEVEAKANAAECQMVDITKDPQSIEENVTEPPLDKKGSLSYS